MKRITIIGGGLAGLTLGIALRHREVPVTIIEAGRYPRHRVCGEFISGAGQQVLGELELGEKLLELGARYARDAGFFTSNWRSGSRKLPEPALCISRFTLDHALSAAFRKLGGELREGDRWSERSFGEGFVCAAGRRAHPTENGWRWFGLKIHAQGVRLEADLEMHVARDSYIGLCRLPNDQVNVCGLFRQRTNEARQVESLDRLRGPQGSALHERLAGAEFDHQSLCAIAGLSSNREEIAPRECRIGDAITMIPPITGNGMSIAFESARIATEPLTAYSRGKHWTEVTSEIAQRLEGALAPRLKWARLLHQFLFHPVGRAVVLPMAFHSRFLWGRAFALTRQ